MSIGWSFLPKLDGRFDGFNDSGIETFQGARYSSLAREVLQNSLDAKDDSSEKPVSVTFEFTEIDTKKLPGLNELKGIMQQCLEGSSESKEKNFFKKALETLGQNKIACLKIDDYNTTGLHGGNNDRDSHWYAITKMEGSSVKKSDIAGGSYGIGKNAPFVVSLLRTVFYYTAYEKNSQVIEKMQGKSILMSHKNNKEDLYNQGTGYYGIIDQCQPIESKEAISDLLRRVKPGRKTQTGTTIFIPGFYYESGWEDEIAAIVLSNFFYAVHDEKLEVVISPQSGHGYCIDKKELENNFSRLLKLTDSLLSKGDYKDKLYNAKAYLDAINNPDSTFSRSTEDPNLGDCQLFIMQKENFPQKVSFIRQTGMLITDELNGLKRFSNLSDFAAVLLCRSKKGNALLRKMENPQHDQFEPERLDSIAERKKGEKTLRVIAKWVREQLNELIGQPSGEGAVPLDEMGAILPNENDETMQGEHDSESDFEGGIVISPKPRKKPSYPSEESEDEDGGENEGGDGQGEGVGEGGGDGDAGGGKAKHHLPIKNFRILQSNSKTNRVVFTPQSNEHNAQLNVYIAGDSTTEKINITSIVYNQTELKRDKKTGHFLIPKLEAGEKVFLDISFNEEIFYPLAIEITKPSEKKY